jgi:hypothetical protein
VKSERQKLNFAKKFISGFWLLPFFSLDFQGANYGDQTYTIILKTVDVAGPTVVCRLQGFITKI